MFKSLYRIIMAAGLGLGCLVMASPASAASYKQVTCYEKVVCYETRTVAYKKHVTRYDECGKPYTVCVTCYKSVKVPVEKVIAVTRRVLVCD